MSTQTPSAEPLPLPEMSAELIRRTSASRTVWSDSRRYPRLPANFDSVLQPASTYASQGHQSQAQMVRLRDLSRAGVRFLGADQLFPGERATLSLPNNTRLHLEIVWCRRVEPGVFMSGCSYVQEA